MRKTSKENVYFMTFLILGTMLRRKVCYFDLCIKYKIYKLLIIVP